jgi:hypothetical protein
VGRPKRLGVGRGRKQKTEVRRRKRQGVGSWETEDRSWKTYRVYECEIYRLIVRNKSTVPDKKESITCMRHRNDKLGVVYLSTVDRMA